MKIFWLLYLVTQLFFYKFICLDSRLAPSFTGKQRQNLPVAVDITNSFDILFLHIIKKILKPAIPMNFYRFLFLRQRVLIPRSLPAYCVPGQTPHLVHIQWPLIKITHRGTNPHIHRQIPIHDRLVWIPTRRMPDISNIIYLVLLIYFFPTDVSIGFNIFFRS